MNNAFEVISEMRRLGATLAVRDGKLIAKPFSVLPAELVERARLVRSEILAVLSRSSKPKGADISTLGVKQKSGHEKASGLDYAPNGEREHLARYEESERSRIDSAIAAELTRIEREALRLGWLPERLWNSGFWDPWPRGLAAVMEAGDRIVEVNGDFIAIERRNSVTPASLRFWRTNG